MSTITVAAARELPLNQRLRWARKKAGLSLDRLAEKVGSSRRHLIRLEKGEHRPGPELVTRIAEATGQPRELFADDEDDEEDLTVELTADLSKALLKLVRRLAEQERLERESA